MKIETFVDDLLHKVDPPMDAMHHSSTMEIDDTNIFDEYESSIFQSIVFYIQSKNLIIEKRDATNKKAKSHTDIKFRKM
jgi:hypothetical protein